MEKYYTQHDGYRLHYFKVINDFDMLHINESGLCINVVPNFPNILKTHNGYLESNREIFDEALKNTLNRLGVNNTIFKFT